MESVLFAAFNISTVTAIVAVNKFIFKVMAFPLPTFLVCIHSAVTHLGLRAASNFGAFEMKSLPTSSLILMAASFIGYNVASQINLLTNTVAFYQISKILITPSVMITEWMFLGKSTTLKVKLAVLVMCVGVGMATVAPTGKDSVTLFGLFMGALAIIGATQQQILIGKMQKDLACSSNQLLVAYTPYSVMMLLVCSPLIDIGLLPDHSVEGTMAWAHNKLDFTNTAIIIFSGCIGLLVSMSTYLLIRATSPLTYNIVGHLKTCSILTSGVVFFGEIINQTQICGIALALTGIAAYSYLKINQPKVVDVPPKGKGRGGRNPRI